MPPSIPEIILSLLRDPGCAVGLEPAVWSDLVPRLRHCGLLGWLAAATAELGLDLPAEVADQLLAAHMIVERQQRLIDYEVAVLGELLAGQVSRAVLLKGAAYQALGLPNAVGRLTSDVDLMVPKAHLARIEHLLIEAGWQHVNRSEYDHHYYRDWMHELPPMRHIQRGTFIDLHHAITPPVSRLRIDSEKLFTSAVPVPGTPFYALSPSDMVLHSICHVLSDGEFGRAIRDFLDIHVLMEHYEVNEVEFWRNLVDRASELGSARMLFYAISILKPLLQTDVPEEIDRTIQRYSPIWPVAELMSAVTRRAVLPLGQPHRRLGDSFANDVMVARSHYLRMPLHLLIPHLVRKSRLRLWSRQDSDGLSG